MIYNSRITTAKDIAAAAPDRTVLKLTSGLVFYIGIYFPPGPSGLVGVKLNEKDVQLYPRNRGDWFTGDNILMEFDETYYIGVEPYEWDIYTYNTDDTYEHTIAVSVGLVSKPEYMERYVPLNILGELIKQVEQKTVKEKREASPLDYLDVFDKPEGE